MAAPKSREELEREAVAWSEADPDYPTVSGSFNRDQKSKTGLEPAKNSQQNRAGEGNDADLIRQTEEQLEQQARANARRQGAAQKVKAAPKTSNAAQLAAMAGSTADLSWLLGIQLWFWGTVQLTLGVASLAFLGAAVGLKNTLVGRVISKVASAANTVTSAIGFDFSVLNPVNLFLVLHILLYGFMILVLLATMFYYATRGRSPVFGTGSGVKSGAIILIMIGSGIPVANLFPWLVIYVLVMWRYPK